jgi:hypothetical protein
VADGALLRHHLSLGPGRREGVFAQRRPRGRHRGFIARAVREPFVSKLSAASLVFGRIEAGACLEIESRMPHGGVIFSDGIEEDYLAFGSGAVTRIGLAERKVRLIVGS